MTYGYNHGIDLINASEFEGTGNALGDKQCIWRRSLAEVGCVEPRGADTAGYCKHDKKHDVVRATLGFHGNFRTNERTNVQRNATERANE